MSWRIFILILLLCPMVSNGQELKLVDPFAGIELACGDEASMSSTLPELLRELGLAMNALKDRLPRSPMERRVCFFDACSGEPESGGKLLSCSLGEWHLGAELQEDLDALYRRLLRFEERHLTGELQPLLAELDAFRWSLNVNLSASRDASFDEALGRLDRLIDRVLSQCNRWEVARI